MIKKVAVFMPSWVGDAVMATPTLRALQRYPSRRLGGGHSASLVGVMQPGISELLRGTPWFSEQILFNKRSWTERFRLALRLRAAQVDAVVLLTNSLWTAMVARLAGVQRLGAFVLTRASGDEPTARCLPPQALGTPRLAPSRSRSFASTPSPASRRVPDSGGGLQRAPLRPSLPPR